MTRRYNVHEALDCIFDHDTDKEEESQEIDSKEALEEEVSEVENDAEYDPDKKEESSDKEEDPAEVLVTFQLKHGNWSWISSPPERRGWLSSENVIRKTPGSTRCALSWVDDIKSCF